MLLHVQHGCKEVTICCTDTDFVVLAVATFQQLGLEILWIGFGMNKDFRWLPIHAISKDLGIRAVELPFFHVLSLDVTLYLHFAERARNLHGKHGRFSQMPQMYSPASAFAVNNDRL